MEKIDHGDRGHALLGGSSSSRWLNCSGSVILSKDCPPSPNTKASLEGTEAHELCEKLLEQYLQYNITGDKIGVTYDLNATDIAEAAKGYVNTIWEKVFHSSIVGKVYKIEDRVSISKKLDMYGFIDLWVVYIDDKGKRCGVIVDFKYGMHEVDAEKNSQLAYYAVALREEFRSDGADLDYVRACIYQPRISGEQYKETKFTSGNLDAWKKKFVTAGENIYLGKKIKFKVGSWCHFCPAQAICKTYADHVKKETTLKLMDIDEVNFPTVETLSEQDVLKIALNEKLIKKVVAECKKYVLGRHYEGKGIEGSKVVTTKAKRMWIGNTDIIEDTFNAVGLEDYSTVKIKGIGEIEKSLKKLVGKDEVPKVMKGLTQVTKTSPIVVSIDDPREAIRLDSSYLLEDIDEEINE